MQPQMHVQAGAASSHLKGAERTNPHGRLEFARTMDYVKRKLSLSNERHHAGSHEPTMTRGGRPGRIALPPV